MDDLQLKLDAIFLLQEPLRTDFANCWKKTSYPKGSHILREGGINNHLFFISKGLARIYYHKESREVTEWFALDQSFFFSIQSFFKRVPSRLAIHALEPAEVFALHHDELMRLCDQHHGVEKLFRRMLADSLIFSQMRMESIQFETAHQRYHRLVTQSPDILQRVPLAYIASFLGITQETLSRVRSGKLF